jgi:hypothetical protein
MAALLVGIGKYRLGSPLANIPPLNRHVGVELVERHSEVNKLDVESRARLRAASGMSLVARADCHGWGRCCIKGPDFHRRWASRAAPSRFETRLTRILGNVEQQTNIFPLHN